MQADAIENLDYQTALQQLTDAVNPMLYFPITVAEQDRIINTAPRPCFYIHKYTKELWYINGLGSQIVYQDDLQSKDISKIRNKDKNDYILTYQKKEYANPSSFHHMTLLVDQDLGYGFRLSYSKMRAIIAEPFELDKTAALLENILMRIKHSKFEKSLSLFSNKSALSEQCSLLVIAQQIMNNKLTKNILYCHDNSLEDTIKDSTDSCYVFMDGLNETSRLWHIDGLHKIELPLSPYQAEVLRFWGYGDSSDPQYAKWGSLTDENSAQNIARLLLFETPLEKNLIEDWSYAQAFDALSDTLIQKKPAISEAVFERCQNIQYLLDKIGEDFYKFFPKTRGIVPHAARIKILSMLTTLLDDPHSPLAVHYLRTTHKVYCCDDFTQSGDTINTSALEPSSFLWFPQEKKLRYIDDKNKIQEINLTADMLKTFQTFKKDGYLSTDAVYDLMTKPHLFYYVYGIPVCINSQWLDFSYFIPTGFDRSQGLHTGTAQEMLRELHDMHLSVRAILIRIGQLILFVGVPLLLGAVGIGIPWAALLALTATQMIVLNWSLLTIHVTVFYTLMRSIFFKNDVMQPELNQLDETLKALNNELIKLDPAKQDLPDYDSWDENQAPGVTI